MCRPYIQTGAHTVRPYSAGNSKGRLPNLLAPAFSTVTKEQILSARTENQ